MKYVVKEGRLEIRAKAPLDDTRVIWNHLSGWVGFEPDDPKKTRAEINVNMLRFDAGEKFKNWKIGEELGAASYPEATLKLIRFSRFDEVTPGQFEGTAMAQVGWRDEFTDVILKGSGSVDRRNLEADVKFTLDARALGVMPPKFTLYKADDFLLVSVWIYALPTAGD